MRWKKARRSDNVVDARGRSGGFRGGRLSLAGIAVIVVIGLLSGQDPLQILGQLMNQSGSTVSPPSTQEAGAPPAGAAHTRPAWRSADRR